MVRKQQIWNEERHRMKENRILQRQNGDRNCNHSWKCSCVTSFGSSEPISLWTVLFFSRLRQGSLWFFFLVPWCIFSFQEVQCFGFFNYLDLAFPIPHLVTVWTAREFPVPKAHMWFLWSDPKLPNLSSRARVHSQLNIFFFLGIGHRNGYLAQM